MNPHGEHKKRVWVSQKMKEEMRWDYKKAQDGFMRIIWINFYMAFYVSQYLACGITSSW